METTEGRKQKGLFLPWTAASLAWMQIQEGFRALLSTSWNTAEISIMRFSLTEETGNRQLWPQPGLHTSTDGLAVD